MATLDHCLEVGTVGKAHGIRGQFKLYSASNQPENFLHYPEIILACATGKLLTLSLDAIRLQGNFAVVSSSSITTRNQAVALTGCRVWVKEDHLPTLGDDEFYWRDIMGASVISRAGDEIGVLTNIFTAGSTDILVIKNGAEEVLIPAQPNFLHAVTTSQIIVDLPPGMLEINKK